MSSLRWQRMEQGGHTDIQATISHVEIHCREQPRVYYVLHTIYELRQGPYLVAISLIALTAVKGSSVAHLNRR